MPSVLSRTWLEGFLLPQGDAVPYSLHLGHQSYSGFALNVAWPDILMPNSVALYSDAQSVFTLKAVEKAYQGGPEIALQPSVVCFWFPLRSVLSFLCLDSARNNYYNRGLSVFYKSQGFSITF